MPKYRVLELSFINERLVQPGEQIEFSGDPGPNLEPLDADAVAARDYYINVKEPERIRKMIEANATPGSTALANPEEFAKLLAKANAEANAEIISKQISEGIAAAFALMFPNGLNKPPAQPAQPAADPGADLT